MLGSSENPSLDETPYAGLFSVDDRSNSLVGSIVESVGRAIIEGELKPGTDLNSVELAQRFHASRTPVREALMILEKEGLVTILPRRRPFVAAISADEVRDIFVVRANLFGLAVGQIVERATDEQLCRIEEAERVQVAALQSGDVDAAFWAIMNFEDMLIEFSGNLVLKRTLAPIRIRTLRLLRLFLESDRVREARSADTHRMVQALRERDADLAVELYRYVQKYTGTLLQQLEHW